MKSKKIGPWNGICTQACWFAVERKCICRCNGSNHGRGVSKKYGKLDDFQGHTSEHTSLRSISTAMNCGDLVKGAVSVLNGYSRGE